jgi:hypothetical protein
MLLSNSIQRLVHGIISFNGIIGGWQFNGVGRTQARMTNFGNVRLVGMT